MTEQKFTQEKGLVVVFVDESDRNQQTNHGIIQSLKSHPKCVLLVLTLVAVFYAVFYAMSNMWGIHDRQMTLDVGWYNTSDPDTLLSNLEHDNK